MLKDIFVVSDAAHHAYSSMLGGHLDGFRARLVALGYRHATIREKLWVVTGLARWMARKRLAIGDLDERRADEFLAARRRRGREDRVSRWTLRQLIEHLRVASVVPTPVAEVDRSALATLLAGYETHLRQARALAEVTIAAYLSWAREFVDERLGSDVGGARALGAGDARDFLLARVHRVAPRRAQYIATTLRSFLRFLFVRGETSTDLTLAVPTVRQWRLANVPRYMPATDVERLLRSCDLSSATGRRDHAVLLLLARLGLRASEVAALELEDLRWREGEIVVRGKGLIRDRLPLPAEVGKALALYLRKDRPSCVSRRIFLCRRAPHRGFGHPSTVSTIVARALVRAGLAPATRGAHLLRHSLATAMIRREASLAEIGQVLRHRSPNTTEIYAKLDFSSLRDVALPWPTARGAQ